MFQEFFFSFNTKPQNDDFPTFSLFFISNFFFLVCISSPLCFPSQLSHFCSARGGFSKLNSMSLKHFHPFCSIYCLLLVVDACLWEGVKWFFRLVHFMCQTNWKESSNSNPFYFTFILALREKRKTSKNRQHFLLYYVMCCIRLMCPGNCTEIDFNFLSSFLFFSAASEGQAQHSCNISNESMAQRKAESHRRLGRGRLSFARLAPLRGSCGGHHHIGSRSQQIWNARETRCWGRLWLGVLWESGAHPLLS